MMETSKEFSCIEVENIGFSNPSNPSWFVEGDHFNPRRFYKVEDALTWMRRATKRDKIRRRVVVREITETYFE